MEAQQETALATTNALLKEKMLRWLPAPGACDTAIEPLHLYRQDAVSLPVTCMYRPSLGIIVQGMKRCVVGSLEYSYGEHQCLLAGVDMPSSYSVTAASPETPYLAVGLVLDRFLTAQLAAEIPPQLEQEREHASGVSVDAVDPDLLAAFVRLVDLLDKPAQIPVLAPMLIREIHYRLLIGPQGERLRRLNTLGTQSNQIAQAITWMLDNYREPLQVETLAKRVNMATSTFHRHFKEVTSLSPLQFHKRLRLYEAQRLMLSSRENATSAGLAVGYESPTQFNREYKRLFGEPPHRDLKRLR